MQNIQISNISTQYLDLQKSFCCTSGKLDLIRWDGCKIGIYKGPKTLFSSEDLSLCSWYQSVNNYAFSTIEMQSNAVLEMRISKINFLFIKLKWDSSIVESEKLIEVGIPKQPGVISSTLPFYINYSDPIDYNYSLINDLMLINTQIQFGDHLKLNNVSKHKVSVSFLYAY